MGAFQCQEALMPGASHCREVLTVRSCSPWRGLDVGSAQVHLLLSMEAEQSGMRYRSECYPSRKLVTVRSSG